MLIILKSAARTRLYTICLQAFKLKDARFSESPSNDYTHSITFAKMVFIFESQHPITLPHLVRRRANIPVYRGANKLCGSKSVHFSSVESGASSRPSNHLLSHTDAVLTLPDGLTSCMISHCTLLCDPRLAEIGPASVSFSRLSASL